MNKEELQKLQDELTEQAKSFIAEAIEKRFGKVEERKKPTLDDYTTIKTYEDACEALGCAPLKTVGNEGCASVYYIDAREKIQTVASSLPAHIVALMKLETISRALWGMEWKPTREILEDNTCFIPIFELNDGILHVDEKSPTITYNAGWIDRPIQLCQETYEQAEYFGRQFIDLWAGYFGFDAKKEGGEE